MDVSFKPFLSLSQLPLGSGGTGIHSSKSWPGSPNDHPRTGVDLLVRTQGTGGSGAPPQEKAPKGRSLRGTGSVGDRAGKGREIARAAHLLRQVLGQGLDADERVVDPHVGQEGDAGVGGGRGAVADFGGNAVQQAAVEADVLADGRVADEAAGNAVAAWYVVARVLQDDGGGAGAAEVRNRADLGVRFDAVHVG